MWRIDETADVKETENVFVAWAEYQRRQESMRTVFGYETKYLGRAEGARLVKLLSYVKLSVATFFYLVKSRPKVVWIQVPPTFPLFAALVWKSLTLGKCVVIADCHNAMFRRPWTTLLGYIALNRCNVVLVHNAEIAEVARNGRVATSKIFVLEDAPAELGGCLRRPEIAGDLAEQWVLYPASFSADEPIWEVTEVAKVLPDVTFVVTGRPRTLDDQRLIADAPKNVLFTGFLDIAEFDWLLKNCAGVLGLTKHANIQLSACNEAVGFCKPMIISNTPTLRSMFAASGAIFVDSTRPECIVEGVRELFREFNGRTEVMAEFKRARTDQWFSGQVKPLRARIEQLTSRDR